MTGDDASSGERSRHGVDEFIVAYDPNYQTAVEIWSEDETLVAELPWGERHFETEANEVLKASIQSDRILVHEVKP